VTTISSGEIWVVIFVAAAGTFALRFSFVGVLKRGPEEIPDLARRALRLIPAAVMAALAVTGITNPEVSFDPWNERMLAALLAAVVAWRTKNVVATIAAGMAALWVLQALV